MTCSRTSITKSSNVDNNDVSPSPNKGHVFRWYSLDLRHHNIRSTRCTVHQDGWQPAALCSFRYSEPNFTCAHLFSNTDRSFSNTFAWLKCFPRSRKGAYTIAILSVHCSPRWLFPFSSTLPVQDVFFANSLFKMQSVSATAVATTEMMVSSSSLPTEAMASPSSLSGGAVIVFT